MAIGIISGNTYSAVEEAVFQEIEKINDRRTPIVLIVPDQYTQTIEVALLNTLKLKCSFNIEVSSFSRLAAKLIIADKPMLNQQTGVMLLAKVIRTVEDKLLIYRKQTGRSGFANNMYAVITALRNSAISPELLKDNGLRMMTGYMQAKFKDIYLIYEAFLKEINENYNDISSLLELFIDEIPKLGGIPQTHYYLFDFASITKIKRNVILELAKHAMNVTVGITTGSGAGGNARLFSQDMRDLISSLSSLGAINRRVHNEALPITRQRLLDKLFSYDYVADETDTENCRISVARNRSEEAEWVACDIRRLIYEGARYRDIAVVVSDLDIYTPILRRHFDSLGLAYYIDDKITLDNQSEIKLIRRASELIKRNGRAKEWLNYIKEPLAGIPSGDAMLFENYIYKYNIGYISLSLTEVKTIIDPWHLEYVSIINKVRSDISALPKGGGITISEFAHGVLEYYTQIKIQDRIAVLRDKMTAKQIELSEQTMPKLMKLLEQAVIMLGEVDYKTDYLYEIIFAACGSSNIASAPIFVDNIFVGNMSNSRYNSVKHLYILGAVQDAYPTPSSDSGILADKELRYLQDKNIYIEPTLLDRIYKGKFELIQLLMRATSSLTITTPKSIDKSAIFVTQVSKLLRINPIFVNPSIMREDIDPLVVATKIGVYGRVNRQIAILQGRGERVYAMPYLKYLKHSDDMDLQGDNTQTYSQQRYKLKNLSEIFTDGYVSVSGIEDYYRCPFRYYANKILKLREPAERELPVTLLGSFMHRILEIFLDRLIQGVYKDSINVEYQVSNDDIRSVAVDIVDMVMAEDYFYIMNFADSNGGFKNRIISRTVYVLKQILRLLSRSALSPSALEFKFGMDNSIDDAIAIKSRLGEIRIRGVIDRIDSDDSYIDLIDYKSSDKKFNLKSIYYGQTLQLLIYAIAAKRTFNKELAGIFYLSLPFKYSRAEEGEIEDTVEYSYNGFVNDNLDILSRLDSQYNDENNTVLPLKYDKMGDIKSTDNLQDSDHMGYMEDYAIKLLVKAAEDISQGFIKPTHTEDSCRICKYGGLCGGCDNEEYERKLAQVKGANNGK